MTEPRAQFWKPVKAVEGQEIPAGAEWTPVDAPNCWDSHYGFWSHRTFIKEDEQYLWRVPVEVCPTDIAVDAIMQEAAGHAVGYTVFVLDDWIQADSLEALRESVVLYLREAANEQYPES